MFASVDSPQSRFLRVSLRTAREGEVEARLPRDLEYTALVARSLPTPASLEDVGAAMLDRCWTTIGAESRCDGVVPGGRRQSLRRMLVVVPCNASNVDPVDTATIEVWREIPGGFAVRQERIAQKVVTRE